MNKVKEKTKRKCAHCEKEFLAVRDTTICCSANCRYHHKRKLKPKKQDTKYCIECGKEFISHKHSTLVCSRECGHKVRKKKKFKTSEGPIECKLCGAKMKRLEHHLKNYHDGVNLKTYKEITNSTTEECYAPEYLERISENMKGENNPGWKHGGRLSPWSKKCDWYSDESKRKALTNREIQGVSKAEDKIFERLTEDFELIQQHRIEWFAFDIVDVGNKKIIEFNGVYWHCKSELYEPDFYHPIKNKTAKKIWESDQRKIELAEKHGYEVLVVWEDDFNQNEEKEIERCREFLSV